MRCSLISSFFIALSLPVCAAEWHDTEGSEFFFTTTFEGVATPGEFKEFDVAFDFDPVDPGAGKLCVRVDLSGADLGDPEMNAVLFDPVWFDLEQFAQAMFISDEIKLLSPGQFLAVGELDLKGTVRKVAVPFSWVDSGHEATMRGEFLLQRSDFDVGSGEWASADAIGIDVSLSFTVRLVHDD